MKREYNKGENYSKCTLCANYRQDYSNEKKCFIHTCVKYLIAAIGDFHVWTACASCSMDDLFKKYTYKDGSPCGKEVEE